jgi:O-methyltransferase domain/Dimerisation domain
MSDTRGHDEISRLRQLIMGFRVTQLIYVAAKLDLADHLARGPLTAPELASSLGVDAGALYRLLRALASLDVFVESSDGRFEMTPAAELLRRHAPGSLHSTAMLYGDELLWRAYGRLSQAIETGGSAFEHVYGQPFYDYLGEHPNSAALFHEAMTGFSELEAAAIMAAYDFSTVGSVVDVGGGQGALAAALLRTHPHLQAVIFDRTPATHDTQKSFALSGIAGRSKFIQGNFFIAVPGGGDLYLLKSILHNWHDSAAATILGKCRDAMAMDARLLVAERVIPSGNAPSEAKLFDINMLVTVAGRERTEAEYVTLFRSAGLELRKVTPTRSHLSLIEAARLERN